jgi:ATP-binding cassette subfamily B (MDR/TAP) protein 1
LLVNEAVKRSRRSKTTIIITHDLTPVEPEDFVYVMREGQVVEEGYRSQLEAADDSWFRQMVKAQSLSNDEGVPSPGQAPTDSQVENSTWVRAATVVESSFLHQGRSYIPSQGLLGSYATELVEVRRASRAARRDSPIPWEGQQSFYLDNQAIKKTYRATMATVEQAGLSASARRPAKRLPRLALPVEAKSDEKGNDRDVKLTMDNDTVNGRPGPINKTIVELVKYFYPSIPNKVVLYLGFFFCVTTGLAPPVFSSLLALLISGLGTGASSATSLKYSLLMLLVAAIDGASQALKYTLLQHVATSWITSLQQKSYCLLLGQDKETFDLPENSASSITNTIVKDAEDARNVIGMIAGQIVAIVAMVFTGLVWSFVVGWQLTLVGAALIPIFIGSTILHGKLSTRYESRNKILREDLAKQFHLVRSLPSDFSVDMY